MGKGPDDLTPGHPDRGWGADANRLADEPAPVVRLVHVPRESDDLERESEVDLRNREADFGVQGSSKREGDDETSEPREVPELRDEIEHTRAEMSETINAIQGRLSPQHLADEARDAVREATFGKAEQMVSDIQDNARNAGTGLMDLVRENPVPAALAGIGLTWLFMGRRSQTSWSNGYGERVATRYGTTKHGRTFYGPDVSDSERGLGRAVGAAATKASDMTGQARETAGRVLDNAGDLASDATERAADMAGTVGNTTRDASTTFWANIRANPIPAALAGVGLAWLVRTWDSAAAERSMYRSRPYGYDDPSDYGWGSRRHADNPAGETITRPDQSGRDAREQADHLKREAMAQATHLKRGAQNKAKGMLEDSPLVLGALALGLGAAAGLAAPPTQREGELMGGTRDALMERTASVLHETQERVRAAAEDAQQALQDKSRGPGSVVDVD